MVSAQTLRAPTFRKSQPYKTNDFQTACCQVLRAPAPETAPRIKLLPNPCVHNVFVNFLKCATISATPCTFLYLLELKNQAIT